MYAVKIRKLTARTQRLKQDIHNAIMSKAPPDKGKGFIVMLGELEDGVLCASYYNTYGQLKKLADYVTAKPERSLVTILNVLESVADTGRTGTLPYTYFCKKARNIVRSLL